MPHISPLGKLLGVLKTGFGISVHITSCIHHCCCCSVKKSCLTLCDPHGLQHVRLPYPLLPPGVCSNS